MIHNKKLKLKTAGGNSFVRLFISKMNGDKTENSIDDTPWLVNFEPFNNRKTNGRIANRLLRLPLMVLRKTTNDFWQYQREINSKTNEEIKLLHSRIQELEKRHR